jgi:hypothetical protein
MLYLHSAKKFKILIVVKDCHEACTRFFVCPICCYCSLPQTRTISSLEFVRKLEFLFL